MSVSLHLSSSLGWNLLCPQEAGGDHTPDDLLKQAISLNTLSKGDFASYTQRCFKKPRAGCSLLRKHWNQTWGPQTPGRTLPGGLALGRPPTARGSRGTGRATGRTDFPAQSHAEWEKRERPRRIAGVPPAALSDSGRLHLWLPCDVHQQSPLSLSCVETGVCPGCGGVLA